MNGDTEDTPEPPRLHSPPKFDGVMVKFEGSRSHSPEKKHHSSGIFGSYATSGRGEIARKPHIDAAIRKVHKKRRRDADRDVRLAHRRGGHGYDTGEPEERSRSRPHRGIDESNTYQGHPPYEMGLIPSIFHFIERHPRLPHILCHYAQVLLNFFLVTFCMYIIYSFWSTIKSDVDEKAREAAHEIMAEMAGCTREYRDNKCDSSSRVPAMEAVCNNWERCMKQDPSLVGRASVSAYTFAGVLNSFFEPLHWKTVVSHLSPQLRLHIAKTNMPDNRYSPSPLSSVQASSPTWPYPSSAAKLIITTLLQTIFPHQHRSSKWPTAVEASSTIPITRAACIMGAMVRGRRARVRGSVMSIGVRVRAKDSSILDVFRFSFWKRLDYDITKGPREGV